jgi:hypothetical protein
MTVFFVCIFSVILYSLLLPKTSYTEQCICSGTVLTHVNRGDYMGRILDKMRKFYCTEVNDNKRTLTFFKFFCLFIIYHRCVTAVRKYLKFSIF